MRLHDLATIFFLGLPIWSGCATEPMDGSAATDDGDDDDGKEDGAVAASKVCTTQHSGTTSDGNAVTICDAAFAQAPHVRPPGDSISSSKTGTSTIYGALDVSEGLRIVDRRGKAYTIVDAKGVEIDTKTSNVSELPAVLHMPSARNMYLVYRFKGTIGIYHDTTFNTDEPSLQLTSAKVVIMLSPAAIDGSLLGAWEGTVTERVSAGKWDPNKLTPIRIEFTKVGGAENNLQTWDSSTQRLKDGAVHDLDGTVANWSTDVAGSDGSCIKSLASLGAKNPFYAGTGAQLSIFRMAAMHFAGDEVVVMNYPGGGQVAGLANTGMSQLMALSPAGFIQNDPTSPYLTFEFNPHGSPTGHNIEIHPVDGLTAGGGACK